MELSLSASISAGLGRARTRSRYIRTWNGSTTFGTFNDPITVVTGDTLELPLASATSGTLMDLLDGVLQFDAGDLLQLTNCTATIDGTPVADGASIAAYLDSKLHDILLTFTGADTITYIGQNGAAANFFSGEILTVTHTPIATGIPLVYNIDDDSLTTTYAEGHASPSTKFITWSNFVASDIELFTYDAANSLWAGVEMYTAGPAWAFDGTEPLFTAENISPNTTIVGGRYKQNLVIASYATGTLQNAVGGVIKANYTSTGSDSSITTATSTLSTVTKLQVTVAAPLIASGTWSVKRVLEEV